MKAKAKPKSAPKLKSTPKLSSAPKPKSVTISKALVMPLGVAPSQINVTGIKDNTGNTNPPYAPQFTVSGTLTNFTTGTIWGIIIDQNAGQVCPPVSTPAAANWSLQFNLTGLQPPGTQVNYAGKFSFESSVHDDAVTVVGINVQF